mmetsp:Transcript_84104/g.261311  ORF Transcript_84104/g.261311 Transcript_84104/m.261311 type:complete len:100 (-) Transcript_84104:355-654(-)
MGLCDQGIKTDMGAVVIQDRVIYMRTESGAARIKSSVVYFDLVVLRTGPALVEAWVSGAPKKAWILTGVSPQVCPRSGLRQLGLVAGIPRRRCLVTSPS